MFSIFASNLYKISAKVNIIWSIASINSRDNVAKRFEVTTKNLRNPSGAGMGEPWRDKNEPAEFLSESQRTTQVGASPPVKREERMRDSPRHVKFDR